MIKKLDVPNGLLKWMTKTVKKRVNLDIPKLIRVPYPAT